MPVSNYDGGFSGGLTVRQMPVLNTYGGTVVWVSSNGGSDGNPGTFNRPLASIDFAVGRLTADNGDIIMVKPNHAETLTAANGINWDVAGVNTIGLGVGDGRPTITIGGTAATVNVQVNAADNLIQNLLFVNTNSNSGGNANMMLITGTDAKIYDCEFRDDGTQDPEQGIQLGAVDADADRTTISGCRFEFSGSDSNCDAAIEFLFDMDQVTIENCHIWGEFEDAGISLVTASDACINLTIKGCYVVNELAANHAIQIVNSNTVGGSIQDCYLTADVAATILDPGGLKVFNTKGALGPDANDDQGWFDLSIRAGIPQLVYATDSSVAIAGIIAEIMYTVTGDILCRLTGTVTTELRTAIIDDGLLSMGVENNTEMFGVFLQSATAAVGTTMTKDQSDAWYVVAGSANIEAVGNEETFDQGAIVLLLEWFPLTTDANVVATVS